ncbi:glycoside hydrolase family 3 C-terminal domain-containing protein [Pedobacter sp. MC2016-14]|uniref:glycoside hydrolase family 3 N-terminal domain-containing protein n=1 Tax=Pedobacter sp. MC2016-14 TaxID=2897327 RepID=UPI001E34C59F|nr:glycoside hydrolase family 3 N-terminal domain-containing protein [Pedobacter sp. MC2016-14]MCD0488708.1 glycoside hydrolase family 3 C-terminal domain-containing protein [Pedobacter sp. MC2016-14]
MIYNFRFYTLAILLALFLCLFCLITSAQEITPLYKNPKAPVIERVNDLIGRMTLEEKVGQLSALLGWEMYEKQGTRITASAKFKAAIATQHIGMLWATLRADPWTKKTLLNGLDPYHAAVATNALQKWNMEHSRLQIPVFIAEECPHGHMAIGTTVFPTAIGQSSTWNPELIESMAKVIAKEARLQGGHIGYGPVLDLARELRWSRVEETYGEDPYLNGRMGVAMVKGFQGSNLKSGINVISTLKHFTAYGVPEGGHNGGFVDLGQRALFQNYLPPFKAAVKAGALSVMTAYNSIDGIPCSSNSFLLNMTLRNQWGFKGFVISDLNSIGALTGVDQVAANEVEAAAVSINSGLDSDLGGLIFSAPLLDAVKQGLVKMERVDEAVARVLRQKFDMGLFEDPYVQPSLAKKEVRNQDAVSLAKQVALESIILLKNENGLLPLQKSIKNIAVIGPNADNMYNQLGDYTAPQEVNNVVTVLQGLKNKLPGARVNYVKGCAIRDTVSVDIEAAVRAASQSDVAIVVLGGSSARDFKTEYLATGAATVGKNAVSDMESGEGFDRQTLDLMGKQLALLQAVVKTGKPVVLVLIEGRPLNLNWPAVHVPAILNAWYPGQQGGAAIADVLFGDYNPAGRLPVSIPKSVGQLPVYYSQQKSSRHDYVEGNASPLYSFGFGLSYTAFDYAKLTLNKVEDKDGLAVTVGCYVKNVGSQDGEEVVQLYVEDMLSSVVVPVKQLRAFQRIPLKAGEEKYIAFKLSAEDFTLFDAAYQQVAEKGEFRITMGADSGSPKLSAKVVLEQSHKIL